MDSAPFDIDDARSRSTSEIPPGLERVSFADIKVDKVYYIRFHFNPERVVWLVAKVTDKGERVVFDSSWTLTDSGVWAPYVRTDVTPAQVDTDFSGGVMPFRYHFYAPKAEPVPNLAAKPAPSGSNKRKARRSRRGSRSSRNNSRRRNSRRNH